MKERRKIGMQSRKIAMRRTKTISRKRSQKKY
jgi:hypothetical protein